MTKKTLCLGWVVLPVQPGSVGGGVGWGGGRQAEPAVGLGPQGSRVGAGRGVGRGTRNDEPLVAGTCCYGDTM